MLGLNTGPEFTVAWALGQDVARECTQYLAGKKELDRSWALSQSEASELGWDLKCVPKYCGHKSRSMDTWSELDMGF